MIVLGFEGVENNPLFNRSPEEGIRLDEILNPEIRDLVGLSLHHAIGDNSHPSEVFELPGGYFSRIRVIRAPFEVQHNRYICLFETFQTQQVKGNKQRLSTNGNVHLPSIPSENAYYSAFHSAPIPLAIIKLSDSTLIEINNAFITSTGYHREQLLGLNVSELGFWSNQKDLLPIGQLLKSKGFVRNYEVAFVLRNSEESHVLLNLDKVEFHHEKCVLAVIQDITPIKQAQAKLKENEDLLISINENLNEGIYRSTPQNGFIYMNNAFAQMFGFSVKEAMNISPEKLYANDSDRDRIKGKLASDGAVKNQQIELRKENGDTFWGLLSSIVTKDLKGNLIYDGAIVDISEIRDSKVLLHEKNEELKQSNIELDRFVYSASHDLRAPLTSLLGLINIASLEPASENMSNYLNMMKGTVNKLDSLISDIINFSRNARLGLDTEVVDFKNLVQESFDHLKYLPMAPSVHTEIEISPLGDFYSDPRRLSILFNNLISNAYRYHDLTKEDPFIRIKIAFDEGNANIQVTDNGQGVDPNHINSIFEMFFRATTDSQGSGLGLYIVKEIVEKLQGTISVDSRLGKGTTFIISLPNLICN